MVLIRHRIYQIVYLAIGCRIRENDKGFELSETQAPYNALFDANKIDIEGKNRWLWNE
jgi:hypothetical protein